MKIYKRFIIASMSFWLSVNIYCCNNSKIIINELHLCTTILDFPFKATLHRVLQWIQFADELLIPSSIPVMSVLYHVFSNATDRLQAVF